MKWKFWKQPELPSDCLRAMFREPPPPSDTAMVALIRTNEELMKANQLLVEALIGNWSKQVALKRGIIERAVPMSTAEPEDARDERQIRSDLEGLTQ